MPVNDDLPALLELVACPRCHGSLSAEPGRLRCVSCDRVYELRERVPALLGTDEPVPPTTLARLQYALLGSPRVYDLQQKLGGADRIARHVEEALSALGAGTLLDVGAGTGMVAGLVSPGVRYVWFDNDALKLRGFLAKEAGSFAVLGDAARLPFPDRAVDWTVMVDVSHHLPDEALRACLREVARVTRHRFVFVDGILGERLRSSLLWKLDLGRFPRRADDLVAHLEAAFRLESVESFRVNHDHLLCVGVPGPQAGATDAGSRLDP